jgi:putative redox protein
MDMKIYFPRGRRVYAESRHFTIETDHPVSEDGDDSAPTPLDLFLASLSTCAGSCALGFMRRHCLDADGSRLIVHADTDPISGLICAVNFELELPADFPDKYRQAVVNAMKACTVKKHLSQPPSFTVTAVKC